MILLIDGVKFKLNTHFREKNKTETNLRMKCPNCSQWNRVPVNKIFIKQPSSKPKVKVLIPMYEPLEVSKCNKCGKIIAKPKELVKIIESTGN